MFDLKSVRPLDAAIAVIAALVLIIGAFLGYSVWRNNTQTEANTPVSRAITTIEAEVRARPNDIDARMRLAQAYAIGQRDNDAIKQYKAILGVKKDYIPALSGLGFLALQNKDYKAGERYYGKIIDLQEGKVAEGQDSTLETAYFYMGSSLLEQRKYEDAVSNFKEALRYKRDASDTHYLLSVALRGMGEDDAARESLGNTLLFDPSHPEANLDYGNILYKEGDLAGAAEHYRKSMNAVPEATQPRDAMERLGTAQEHIAAAKKAMSSKPASAVAEARIAAAIDPTAANLVLVGDAYAAAKDKKNAAQAYQKAIDIDPKNAAALAGLKRVESGS